MIRHLIVLVLLMLLAGCVETRFESPLGDNIETCDARWKGLWIDRDNDTTRTADAFEVDGACELTLLDQPEPGGPLKRIRVAVNFVHDGGSDYLVVSDAQIHGLGTLDPPYGIKPAPAKSFFFVKYRLRGDVLELYEVDSERTAGLVIDGTLDGTVSKTAGELHVYVRGDRVKMLEIVRRQHIFSDKPAATLQSSRQSAADYEAELIRRQRGVKR